mmetsp:Transcript_35931/g.91839  ORF Transcript_35931/g.91839 Transcript_35931/m.91839 type:complete len:81 (-) Transcript_35931:1151-1393(-)
MNYIFYNSFCITTFFGIIIGSKNCLAFSFSRMRSKNTSRSLPLRSYHSSHIYKYGLWHFFLINVNLQSFIERIQRDQKKF